MTAQETLSRAHYRDAWLYDRRYGRRKLDIPHYLGLVESRRGTWLELGAGTGRLTLPLAEKTSALVAVEREPALAKTLKARAPQHVQVRVGDFTKIALSGPFAGVVAPFNTFSHVFELAQLQALLERLPVRRGGIVAFDVPMPQPSVLARDPDRFYRVGFATGPDRTRYAYSEAFDYDAAAQRLLVIAQYKSKRETFVLPLLQRMHFPAELRFVAESAGYDVLRHDGGFAGEPLDGDADSQVIVLEKRAATARRGR